MQRYLPPDWLARAKRGDFSVVYQAIHSACGVAYAIRRNILFFRVFGKKERNKTYLLMSMNAEGKNNTRKYKGHTHKK